MQIASQAPEAFAGRGLKLCPFKPEDSHKPHSVRGSFTVP
jgi:hypothetical protein